MAAIEIANKNLWVLFEYKGQPICVTESLVSLWVVMGILIAFAVVVRVRLKNFTDVPKGFQNFVETTVEMMHNLARNSMGPKLEKMGGYFYAIFAFILCSNYSGIFMLRPPTADLATTAAMGLSTFGLIHFFGMTERKGAYFKEYLEPTPVLLPINIVGELAKPVSLSFRLFGNLVGGMIIIGIMYSMMPTPVTFLVPTVAHIWFDVFVGFLQTFIFVMLSMTFIQQKAYVIE